MLTEKQKAYHWRLWGDLTGANYWRNLHGRLSPHAKQDCSEFHVAVWNSAYQFSLKEHRHITPEDLRHGCYFVAARKASMADLTQADFNKVVTLFQLLINPDDLTARVAWDNPEIDTKRAVLAGIKKIAPLAYIRAVTRGKWGTEDWEDLGMAQLRQLIGMLKSRAKKKPFQFEPEPEPAMAGNDNAPF